MSFTHLIHGWGTPLNQPIATWSVTRKKTRWSSMLPVQVKSSEKWSLPESWGYPQTILFSMFFWLAVTGTWLLFSHILGIIIQLTFICLRWVETTNQFFFSVNQPFWIAPFMEPPFDVCRKRITVFFSGWIPRRAVRSMRAKPGNWDRRKKARKAPAGGIHGWWFGWIVD